MKVARESAAKPEGVGCLLQGGKPGAGSALAAPLDSPAASLIDPPADLDALFTNGLKKKPFTDLGTRIFTPAGYSEGGDYLDLVTFTPASRIVITGVTPILVATDLGLYLALANTVSDGNVLTAKDRKQIVDTLVPQAKAWVITGEGDAPIETVREALALIAATDAPIVLASPLPKASKPKKRISRYDSSVAQGQPFACATRTAPGIEAGPIGSYDSQRVSQVLLEIRDAMTTCKASGSGGTIHVRVRVDPKGALVEACAETDDTQDLAARKCAVESIKKLSFPPPDKPGFVNLGGEAVLPGNKLRALCDP